MGQPDTYTSQFRWGKLIVDVLQTAIKFHNNKIISINVPNFGKEFKKDLVLVRE